MSITEIDDIEEITVVKPDKAITPPKIKENLSFRCLECDYRARDKFQMEDHRKNYHKDMKDDTCISYICIDCGKVFVEDENYQTHMVNQPQEEPSIVNLQRGRKFSSSL